MSCTLPTWNLGTPPIPGVTPPKLPQAPSLPDIGISPTLPSWNLGLPPIPGITPPKLPEPPSVPCPLD